MLQKFIMNRVMGKVYELVSGAVRHGIGMAGAWLMSADIATQGQIDSLEGGAMAGVAIAWSFARKLINSRRLGDDDGVSS